MKDKKIDQIPLNLPLTRETLKRGFTLVELLVVISIISILTIVSVSSYRTAQIKARDAERKAELVEVSKALMLYYNDVGKFPDHFDFGNVTVGFVGGDGTIYMRETPLDPKNEDSYKFVYKYSTDQKKFALFANLENKEDSQCKDKDNDFTVDGVDYCYALSSSNTTPKEFLQSSYL